MPYAVLQKTPEPIELERLQAAFQQVPGLTRMDAVIMGRDALGIVGRDLDEQRAMALSTALAAQGLPTEVVDEANLPQLPPSRQVHRMDCLPEALMIYDPMGRTFPLEWKNIMLIAAGRAKLSDFNTKTVTYKKFVGREYVTVTDRETQEKQQEHLLLEIVILKALLRYTIFADKPGGFSFQYLGARMVRGVNGNFNLLIQDLLTHAPNAILNRGAVSIQSDPKKPYIYPSKTAFHQEMIWLIRQASLQQNGN